MSNNFWQELREQKKPFFCMAPMADVTDAAFRALVTKYGKPDVLWTEFVSANGLNSKGREALMLDLKFSEKERPILAQLFSADPVNMEAAAKLCAELGFDGIDINMGCPDKTIEKQGAGACMIKSPEVAKEIISAVKRGIASAKPANGRAGIPVSVKTRVGYNTVEINTWIKSLLEQDIAALTVHARTRKEMSKVPAKWDYIKEVVELRNKIAPNTVIIGNGDVVSLADGREKAKYSGCDGIMIGRAIFGNPWVFDQSRGMIATLPKKRNIILRSIPILNKLFGTKRRAAFSSIKPITVEERLNVMVEHAELFEKLLGKDKNFSIMKKHFKAYATGFDGAKELRMKLMETNSASEVAVLVNDFLTKG